MRYSFFITLFASLIAVNFGQEDVITTEELSVGEISVDDHGITVVPIIGEVFGHLTTIYFSVVDGVTIYINDPTTSEDTYSSIVNQGVKDNVGYDNYVQKVIEAAESYEYEGASSYEPEPSLSLSEAVKRVVQQASSL